MTFKRKGLKQSPVITFIGARAKFRTNSGVVVYGRLLRVGRLALKLMTPSGEVYTMSPNTIQYLRWDKDYQRLFKLEEHTENPYLGKFKLEDKDLPRKRKNAGYRRV